MTYLFILYCKIKIHKIMVGLISPTLLNYSLNILVRRIEGKTNVWYSTYFFLFEADSFQDQ